MIERVTMSKVEESLEDACAIKFRAIDDLIGVVGKARLERRGEEKVKQRKPHIKERKIEKYMKSINWKKWQDLARKGAYHTRAIRGSC